MDYQTSITTGKVRLSYVHLLQPYANVPGQEEKYSCTILLPKSDTETMNRIQAAIEAAKEKGVLTQWNGIQPPVIPVPVYDGDGVRPSDGMPFGDECKGHWVLCIWWKKRNWMRAWTRSKIRGWLFFRREYYGCTSIWLCNTSYLYSKSSLFFRYLWGSYGKPDFGNH